MPECFPCQECQNLIRPQDEYVSGLIDSITHIEIVKYHAACWLAMRQRNRELATAAQHTSKKWWK